MSKRRTRKDKLTSKAGIQAAKDLRISWSPSTKKSSIEASVNSQIQNTQNKISQKSDGFKTAEDTAKLVDIEYVRKDIRKSLIDVSLVLALEMMLYFAWIKFW